MPSSIRPPEMLSSVAAVIAVIAGVRAGHLEDRRAELDLLGVGGQPGEHGGGVRAVGLGRPDGVEARRLGLADDLELLLGGQPETPVADVQTQPHATPLSDRGTTLKWPTARRTLRGPAGETGIVWDPTAEATLETSTQARAPAAHRDRLHARGDARGDARRRSRSTRSSWAPTPTASGGVCPMLAAHRNGGRTSFASFARAWDRYTRAGDTPRRATEREVRTLKSMLRGEHRDRRRCAAAASLRRGDRRPPRRPGAPRAARGARAGRGPGCAATDRVAGRTDSSTSARAVEPSMRRRAASACRPAG